MTKKHLEIFQNCKEYILKQKSLLLSRIRLNEDNYIELEESIRRKEIEYKQQQKLFDYKCIKILFHIAELKSEVSGVEQHIYRVIFQLKDTQIEDFFVCESEEKAYIEAKKLKLPIVKIEEI